MRILQVTDPHLYGNAGGSLRGVETDSSLRSVLHDALADQDHYAAILVTGDLVQDDPSGYLRFKSIFGGFTSPVLCIPGNHDEPDAMRHSLAHPPFQYCGSLALGAWQVIMLNSYDPGHVGGRLSCDELQRLDAQLASSPAHALVCLHHHPVDMGSRWLDDIGLVNREDFWGVIDAHSHVRAIMWGHVHQNYEAVRNGVQLIGTPSTCAQFAPYSDRFATDASPPAYRTVDLHDDGGIRSELNWVEPLRTRKAVAR